MARRDPDFLLWAFAAAVVWLVGKPVVRYASGVIVGARTRAANEIEAAAAAEFGSRGYEVTVTSAREGAHMAGSAHPGGNARDFRSSHVRTLEEKRDIVAGMAERLGPAFDVLLEWNPEHIHAELDPQRGAGYV